MQKKNLKKTMTCREFNERGGKTGGRRVKELCVCPVARPEAMEGAHEGEKTGQVCWVVAGTLLNGWVQGAYMQKITNCRQCNERETR